MLRATVVDYGLVFSRPSVGSKGVTFGDLLMSIRLFERLERAILHHDRLKVLLYNDNPIVHVVRGRTRRAAYIRTHVARSVATW